MKDTYCIMSFDLDDVTGVNDKVVAVGLSVSEAQQKIKELEITTDLSYYTYPEVKDEGLVYPRRVTSKEGFPGAESTLRLAIQHLAAVIKELENFPDMDTGEDDSACCNLRQAVECISESLGDMDG